MAYYRNSLLNLLNIVHGGKIVTIIIMIIPRSILNGISFFLYLVEEKLNMPSGHYYRHCSWSGRSNHLIKVNTSHCLCEMPRLLIIFIIFAVRYPFSRAIICGIIVIRSEWFFDCFSPFCFLLIEFQCTFFIFYKIIPYYVYYSLYY